MADDTRYRIREPRSGATREIPDGALDFFPGWEIVETIGAPTATARPAVLAVHGNKADALRPETHQPVLWYGSVQPLNLDVSKGDEWVGDSLTVDELKATFGSADPVLSDFSYDTATGNLLSYKEDGVSIVLTYNPDGTVATSQRGSGPVRTYSYFNGNLAGVA